MRPATGVAGVVHKRQSSPPLSPRRSRVQVTPDAPTASMADDVFYILQKCATRTLSIGSVQCVCAGLNHVNNLLGEQFSAALARRLRGGASKALSVIEKLAAVSSHPPLSRPPGLEFLVAVNTADVSAEYVVKLRRELEGGLAAPTPISRQTHACPANGRAHTYLPCAFPLPAANNTGSASRPYRPSAPAASRVRFT
jgi:hypothetical protein